MAKHLDSTLGRTTGIVAVSQLPQTSFSAKWGNRALRRLEHAHCDAPGFLVQQVDAYGPVHRMATVLRGEFIEAAFEATGEPEVMTVQGENLAAEDGIVEPVR